MARRFALIKRSLEERPLPDLFIFALIGKFAGYFPGYSKMIADQKNYLTWCILKAHTKNHGGTVELRSTDPRDPPQINFHYFKEGTDNDGDDLASVVAGIKFVRTLTKPAMDAGIIVEEELPAQSADRRRDRPVRAGQCLGPSRLLHLQDRAAERSDGRARQQFPRLRHQQSARGRCLGVPENPRLLHRLMRLHDRREGGRRDPGRGRPRQGAAMHLRPGPLVQGVERPAPASDAASPARSPRSRRSARCCSAFRRAPARADRRRGGELVHHRAAVRRTPILPRRRRPSSRSSRCSPSSSTSSMPSRICCATPIRRPTPV